MRQTYKGKFIPKNPQKYIGNAQNIIYRSSWELKLMKIFDSTTDIIEWSSEEIFVPYYNPVDKRMRRYFPDFVIKRKSKTTNNIDVIMIEVKPHKQTSPPTVKARTSSQRSRKFISEAVTYAINSHKWAAARKFCEERGWKFQIMTEHELGIK
jgi:hypothetical protein